MKIKLTIAGKEVELTVSEAKQLYKQLSELFDGEMREIPWVQPEYPIQPLGPYYPPQPLTPYSPPSYPYVTCENSNDNTGSGSKNPFQRYAEIR